MLKMFRNLKERKQEERKMEIRERAREITKMQKLEAQKEILQLFLEDKEIVIDLETESLKVIAAGTEERFVMYFNLDKQEICIKSEYRANKADFEEVLLDTSKIKDKEVVSFKENILVKTNKESLKSFRNYEVQNEMFILSFAYAHSLDKALEVYKKDFFEAEEVLYLENFRNLLTA